MALEALRAIARALSNPLSPTEVGELVALHCHERFAAMQSVVYVHEEDAQRVTLVACRGIPEEALPRLRRFPLDTRLPLFDSIRDLEPRWYETNEAMRREYPNVFDDAGAAHPWRSVVALPFCIDGRALGGVGLSFADERTFEHLERELLLTVADLAAHALERARLLTSAHAARLELERANRSKDEMITTVSHELRTPLNAILGWSSILKERALDESVRRPVEVIDRNARLQLKIVDDLLDLRRVSDGRLHIEPRMTDVVGIVQETMEVIRPLASEKDIALSLQTTNAACVLAADPERLLQVAINLLSNAVKFTPTGGKVQVSVNRDDTSIVLRVVDDGIGIEPAFLPYVFERFKQAETTGSRNAGVGLGLALVKHIVELHGGSVVAASEGSGRGATFTVQLPIRS